MSQDMMVIPEAPAYILNMSPEAAKQANEDAAAGISTGYAARLKINGKAFALVDGNGEETPIKAGEMTIAADGNSYLPVVVLRAKRELQKAWYASAYKTDEPGQAPDCFSNDGMMPDASAPSKQCESCAACPMNAFGSGTDQSGAPTAGKACSDSKIIAVFVKGAVHKFKIPPASLKTWALFVKQLGGRGIPIGNIKTLIGFDDSKSFPVLRFEFGGYMTEPQLAKLAELAASPEAEEIVTDTITAKALPAPTAKPKIAAVPEPAPAPEEESLSLDLGLVPTAPVASVPEPAKTAEVVTPTEGPSDEDLAAMLDL